MHRVLFGWSDDTKTNSEPSTESFSGGRLQFFRRLPSFFFDLEWFMFYAAICIVDTVVTTLIAPATLLLGRGGLRQALTTTFVAAGLFSLYLATPPDSRLYSSIYHTVRASSIIKLYVIFNILELAEKLLSAFSTDVIEALWSVVRLEKPRSARRVLEAGILFAVAVGAVMTHTLILLGHVATINVAINSEGSSLVGLLISNNFVEVKSIVFKKHTPEALFAVVNQDAVERVQHFIFIAVMLLQHMQTEGLGSLEGWEIALIVGCEMAIDFIKHVFVARFNSIPLQTCRRFTQCYMLDVALRAFLQDLDVPIGVASSPRRSGQLSSQSFTPNPSQRAAFVPFPYVSLLLWAAGPIAWSLLHDASAALALSVAILVLAALLLRVLITGIAIRFACQHWLRRDRLQTSDLEAHAEHHPFGVTPPLQSVKSLQPSPATHSRAPLKGRLYMVLDPFIAALSRTDRFDLQVGKSKK